MSDPAQARPQDEGAPLRRVSWQRVLVWFMRVMAVVWIVKGLGAWTIIIASGLPGIPPFPSLPFSTQAALVSFALLDLVAAIGLWLTSTWGGVMWLLAVMSHVVVTVLRPGEIGTSVTLAVLQVVLVVSYVALSWLASRDE